MGSDILSTEPMSACGFALFETAIGVCGIAWSGLGIAGVQLPEVSEAATRNRMRRRFPRSRETAPPADVQRVIEDITALIGGKRQNLCGAILDETGLSDFQRQVYAAARTIPVGSTTSYGELAARVGDRTLAREVGEALGQNPFPIIVPCHRVMAAGGKMGGFSAPGGVRTKLRLLSAERAQPSGPILFPDLPLVAPPRRGP